MIYPKLAKIIEFFKIIFFYLINFDSYSPPLSETSLLINKSLCIDPTTICKLIILL